MTTLKFTTEHEWLRQEDNGEVTVGITDYAQQQLGDIVYVELPASGARFDAVANLAIIESVKAVGEITMPIAGTVIETNPRLVDEPELVNQDPEGAGWLLRATLDDAGVLETLMDEAAYQLFVASL